MLKSKFSNFYFSSFYKFVILANYREPIFVSGAEILEFGFGGTHLSRECYIVENNRGEYTYILVACQRLNTFSVDILDIFFACTCQSRNRNRICIDRRHSL